MAWCGAFRTARSASSTFAWAPSRSRWACFPPGVDSAAFRRSISATRGGSHSFTVTNRQSPKNQTCGRQKHEPKHELHRKRKAPQVKHKNTFFRVEPLHFCLGNVFQDNSSSRWPIVDFGGALLVFGWVLRSTDHCSRNRFPSIRVAP